MPPPTYEDLKLGMLLMWALLCILAAMSVRKPEFRKPKAVPEPTCPLHKIPRDRCAVQHEDETP